MFGRKKRSAAEASGACLDLVQDEAALDKAVSDLGPSSRKRGEQIRWEVFVFRVFWAERSVREKLAKPGPVLDAFRSLLSQTVQDEEPPEGRPSAIEELEQKVAEYAALHDAPARSTGDRLYRIGLRFGENAGVSEEDMAPLMPVVVDQAAVTKNIREYLDSVRLVADR